MIGGILIGGGRAPWPPPLATPMRRTPLTTSCAPPFWFTQNACSEYYVTTRQHAIMEKEMISFKHNSFLKFS